MAWAYTGDLSKPLDWVRFTIGDTTESDALMTDAEITSLLTLYSKNRTALLCMENILATLSKSCDYKIGPESVALSDRYKNYQTFYLAKKASLSQATLSPQVIQTPTGNTEDPIFTIGMDDNNSSDCGVN